MGAVGVDAGLEPGPGVHELHEREAGGDLADHGSGGGQGHLVLGHPSGHGVDAGLGTQVADSSTVTDQVVLLGRLDGPHPHGRRADIHQLDTGQGGLQGPELVDRQVVELHAQAGRAAHEVADSLVVVVPSPVRVHEVVPVGAPPRLAAVDTGRDSGGVLSVDHHPVLAAEVAEDPARVVADVVVRGQEAGVDALCSQVVP